MMLEQVTHLCSKQVMTPDSFYALLAGQTVEKIDYQHWIVDNMDLQIESPTLLVMLGP